MVEKKRKARDDAKQKKERGEKKRKNLPSKPITQKNSTKRNKGGEGRKRTGPHLPSGLRRELDLLNPKSPNSDEEIDSDEGEVYQTDLYEYEEGAPEEESKKNKRFDPVENFDYELPDDFEDENVRSDDDDDEVDGHVDGGNDNEDGNVDGHEDGGNDSEDADGGRMLQETTRMPSEAIEGRKKKKDVITEAYPESEFNPSRDVLDGNSRISMQDLLDSLRGQPGYSKIRKRMQQMEKKSVPVQAPLPKAEREKLERKATYEQSKKDIAKWEPLVKRNREAPTIYFDEDTDLRFSTVGAIASEFEPRTDFEKKMAALVRDDKVMEAHSKDGSRLLELNKISIEDVKDRQNRLAKMRSLLFRHELKSKHIKKIKSKTYHRLMKKDRLKAASAEEIQMDPEAAKEHAMKQEFKRAEERMRLKHKNSSKWAKRILKRGLNVQDEGTRAALTEQLHQHALLTRKMNSMNDGSSSSDDSSDEDDDDDEVSADSDQDGASKLLAKAKEKTLKVVEEDDEMPKSGVFSLPFMVRGIEKRKEEVHEEAKLALQEFEASLKHPEAASGAESPKISMSNGRRVFGAVKKQVQESSKKTKRDIDYDNSDSEADLNAKDDTNLGHEQSKDLQKDVNLDVIFDHEDSVKNFDDTDKEPGPKTTYDVAIFASGSFKKMNSESKSDVNSKQPAKFVEPAPLSQVREEVGEDSDTDSEGNMVDGILTSGTKLSYELPSQAELIHLAFAGDDVEEDFEKEKLEMLKEEVPEPEKPVLLPGWGQWTRVQQKKGLPSWMVKEHEDAKRRREEALKRRKDAHLKNVIISEKVDKKAEKLHTKTLPFPFTSKEVFEQSIRMPIGPESNPATTIGALNRPEVVKRSGLIIRPIKFEDVNPHEKLEEHKQSGHKQKTKNTRTKTMKKTKTKAGKR